MKVSFLIVVIVSLLGAVLTVDAAETAALPRPAAIEIVGNKTFKISDKTSWLITGADAKDSERLTRYVADRFPDMAVATSKNIRD